MKTRKSRFKFSMVRIGETIVFAPTGIEVKVASDDSVEYEGRVYKLSPFVGPSCPQMKETLPAPTKVRSTSPTRAKSCMI